MASFKPATSYETLDLYRNPQSPQDLAKIRRTLAKRANQRIVRLERASSSITGEKYAEIGALPIAKKYLEKQGRNRFNESAKTKLSYEEQRREVLELQRFLTSKTSLVSGIREIERKRIETFESGKWGSAKWTDGDRKAIKFASTKEFYDFFQSSVFRELLSAGFTSEQIIEAYDQARETYNGSHDETLEKLKDALEKFREQGKISLKDLRAAAGGKALV